MKALRTVVSGSRIRYQQDGFDLDLTYITPTLIAMAYPASGVEKTYRNDISEVAKFLNSRHFDHYKVFNLSERCYDYSKFNHQVSEVGFPDHHPPPLPLLIDIMNEMLAWSRKSENNVLVVHCLAGKGRTGVICSCYLLFSGFYGNIFNLRTNRECRDLANLSIRDFWNARGQGVRYPSQALYIYYFIKIIRKMMNPSVNYLPPMPRSRRMWLKRVTLYGIPDFGSGHCTPFLQVLPSGWQHHKTELLYNSSWDQPQFATYEADVHGSICFETNCLIQGDITIRCFHASSGGLLGKNVSQMFHFAFHTDFLGRSLKHHEGVYRLSKYEIDDANLNRRFPEEFHVDCYLAQDQNYHEEDQKEVSQDDGVAYLDFDMSSRGSSRASSRGGGLGEFADENRRPMENGDSSLISSTMALSPPALARSVSLVQPRNSVTAANSASMMGWLFKQGGFVKNWKRRWFVLKDGKLCYYADASRPTPLGVVDLRNAVVDPCSSSEIQGKSSNLYYFKVIPSKEKRIWYFGANTENEMARWIRSISKESCYDITHPSGGLDQPGVSSSRGTSNSSSRGTGVFDRSSASYSSSSSSRGSQKSIKQLGRSSSKSFDVDFGTMQISGSGQTSPQRSVLDSFSSQDLDARPSSQLSYREHSATELAFRESLQQQQQQQPQQQSRSAYSDPLGSLELVASRPPPPPPPSSMRSAYRLPSGSNPLSFSSSPSSTSSSGLPPRSQQQQRRRMERLPSEDDQHFLDTSGAADSASLSYVASKPIAFNAGITEVERHTMLEEVEKKKYVYTIDELEKMMQLQQQIRANREHNAMLRFLVVQNPMEAQSFIVKFLIKEEYQMLLDAFECDADAFVKKIIGEEIHSNRI